MLVGLLTRLHSKGWLLACAHKYGSLLKWLPVTNVLAYYMLAYLSVVYRGMYTAQVYPMIQKRLAIIYNLPGKLVCLV